VNSTSTTDVVGYAMLDRETLKAKSLLLLLENRERY